MKEDSARVGQPFIFNIAFASGKSALSKAALRTIDSVGAALAKESDIRLMITTFADTTGMKGKSKTKPLARQRIDLVKAKIVAKYGIPEDRVLVDVRPRNLKQEKKETRDFLETHVDLQILGRQPYVITGLETVILAPSADERAAHADSLKPHETSQPFPYKVGFSIVRLDRREPARRKQYEEAGAEVSSLFQDYEAKRLEKDWMDRVEKAHPVVVNKEALRQAFASPQK